MSVTAEEVRRKIENARNAGDDRAVQALEGYLQTLDTPAPDPAQAEPVQQTGALPDAPDPEQQPVADVPALQEGLTDDQRKESLYLNQFNRDQEIAKQQYANPGEVDWASRAEFLANPDAWDEMKTGSQQAIQDPETGEWRWTALSPEQIAEIENPSGLTGKAALGALTSGVVRQVGQRIESIDEGIDVRRNIQSFVWEQLPAAEQQRIRESIAKDAEVDVEKVTPEALSTLSAYQFKKYLDQNPDNEEILANMMGDEEAVVRGERWRRIGNRISAVVPRMPVNVFGAQETMGGVIGQGAYEDIEYSEDQRAPIYPGASQDIGDWLEQADSPGTGLMGMGGFYEYVIRPTLTTKEGRLPGQSVSAAAQFIKKETRSEAQAASGEKPFFPEDMTWRDSLDPEFWTDPETKLPWNDFTGFSLTFLETTPQIAEGIVAARTGGRVGASQAVRHYAGSTLQRIESARRNWAMTGGVLTGGTAEGLMIRDEVASDVRQTLTEVPIEKFREDEVFQAMVAAGMTEEEARQVLISDSSRVAGDTAFWVAGVGAGSPMSAFFGRMGAGRLGGKTTIGQMMVGGLGEGLQEGNQEVIEGEISDWAIKGVDPENPIFSNPNRRLERFGGGFFTGGPIGALSSVEPSEPAGLQDENKEAMEAAQKYMEATNERVKFERSLPPPQEAVTDPIGRLQQLQKLEQMQQAEAEALLAGYDTMKEYFEANPSQTSNVELKMLNSLRLRANSTLTDIAVARSRRQSAQEMVEEQEQILRERAAIQRQVTEDVMTLEDIDRQLSNIESVQNNEPIEESNYEELLKAGYGRWSNSNKDKFVLTPKGKRATNLLNQQRSHMTRKLEAGYTGKERRNPANIARRQAIEQAGPQAREEMLYTDAMTGVQNRRAFNERVENAEPSKKPKAVAAVDVDGLAWVNDNMGHVAGDRLLMAVADAIRDQKGVEIFRLGGDEFAVTGASDQQLENALQVAARSLRDEPIADNEQEVTPQITWGKGKTYEEADLEAGRMKRDRVQRKVIADRKAKPTTWRARAQMGLFQLDESGAIKRPDDAPEIASKWRQVRDEIRRRDFVEILTPTGAVPGIVTDINRSRSRPRLEITAHGRKYKFNPERNHLITHNTDPADIAWLTGEDQLADPLYGPLPQVIQDVQIGHIGHMDGTTAEDFYADLGFEVTPQKQLPWWVNEHPEWSMSVPYVPELRKLSEEEARQAEAIVRKLTAGYNNLPTVNLVTDIKALKKQRPEIVEQMVAEGGENILHGARGYMNHQNPQDGIYILAANIKRQAGLGNFEKGIAETLMHEMIGHYGVRGFFGNEAELRGYMIDLVDSFPKVAESMSTRIGVMMDTHAGKQLVGEEMVAYLAGEVLSGKRMDLNQKQKTLLQKIWDWVKQWLVKNGWATPEDTDTDNEKGFWNDERVQTLIHRSQDFVRNGKGFEWTAFTGQRVRFMRDADIFQQGIVTAINVGTKTLPKSQRKQMALKKEYGGDINRVPKQVPIFPEVGSPNIYREALIEAQKQGYISKKEMEYSGLNEKSNDYAFLRDATYKDIQNLLGTFVPNLSRDWYKQVLPVPLATEVDAIYEAIDKAYMVGPVRNPDARPVINQVTVDTAQARLLDIFAMPIDQKKTQLSKDILLAHAASNKALRVSVRRQGGYPEPTRDEIGRMLLGDDYDPDNLSVFGKDMIEAEVQRSRERGPDIGYSEKADRWFDWSSSHSYSEYSPQGAKSGSTDHRVVLIQQEGSHEMGTGSSQHWEPNLFHVRTGVAQALNIDGESIIPDAPNPDMQDKFLSMIELQSDWLQDLRKAFGSRNELEKASDQLAQDRENLRNLGLGFVTNLSADIWAAIDDQLKPIYNLPEGRLGPEYRAFAEAQYEAPWDEISDTNRENAYMEFVSSNLDPFIEKLNNTRRVLGDTRIGAVFEDIPGSMDARAFDRLDQMAVGMVVETMYSDFDQLISELEIAKQSRLQEQFVATVNRSKARFLRRTIRAFERGSAQATRLPYAKEKIKEMLAPALAESGMDISILGNRIEDMSEMQTAHIRVPVARLQDYSNAALDSDSILMHVQNMFANGRLLNAGVQPNGLNRSFNATTDGDFVQIDVFGTKEQIDNLQQKLEEIISTYVKEVGPSARSQSIRKSEAQRERDARRERERQNLRVQQTAGNVQEPSYDEIETELGLEEIDVDDPSGAERSLLSDFGIQTFESFEESYLPDERDEIISYAWEHMDWEGVTNDDGEGLWGGSTDYQERVHFDDDGDPDTEDAQAWLREAREQYRQEMYEEDQYYDQAYENIREKWNDDGPTALITGELPYAWDEDGDVDDNVPIRIQKQEYGDYYYIFIDGEEYGSETTLDGIKEELLEAIRSYYNDQDVTPPAGSIFAPVDTRTEQMFPETLENIEVPTEEEAEALPDPNWDLLVNGIVDETSMISGKPLKSERIFERMVQLQKKIDKGRIVLDSPLADDRIWRPIALKYLLSDAVRRGFPGVIWNNGLASARRGGNWGMGGTIPTSRVLWTQERMTVRGQTHNMIVIRSPELSHPLVLDPRRMIPSLGRDLASHILQQIEGKIPLTPEEVERQDDQAGQEPRDRFLVSSTASGHMAVHRRDDGQFVGFARSEEEVNDLIQEHDRPIEYLEVADPEVAAIGEQVLMQGKVTSKSFGSAMRIITANQPYDYSHTFDIPRLAAARTSYEEVTHRAWEKELKKYGATIKTTYVKAADLNQAEFKEGQPVKKVETRDEEIRRNHGEVTVEELTGETHGWVVMSERDGPLTDNIYTNRSQALDYLKDWKDNNFGRPGGGVKVYYIEINDKIREEFSGPVAPFHYDPKNDPDLKEAAEKIGYEDVSLREKMTSWKQAWKDNWQQGMFDRFYGIRRALELAGEKRDGYIETRLTTSLDSVMKAVLEYGAPVWRDGMTETEEEGRGLLEILQPVMKQVDLWGMYMVGVRAKRLLAEGREQLFTPEEIDSMIALGDKYPQFERVAADYAEFNKKVLDYAEGAGVINAETRPMWENADYIPFYRVEDDRLVGPFSGGAGVANQRSPIKRLKGGEANIGNPIHNIMVNLTRLMDSSMKNRAALTTVDALRGSGIVSKQPMTFSQQMIPLNQVKKLLIDRGMNPDTIPQDALEGFQKMFAIQPPEGPGVISVLRNGKKEFYYTDDPLLYRAMTSINKKAWGRWMSFFRYPKRLLTTLVTLDPGFMAANYMRDSLSAFVLSRDNFVPVAAGIKGFGQALVKDKAMRTMLAAGAAFESGYINQYDPNSTQRLIKKAMRNKSFSRTVLNSPAKLLEAWKAIGSATENANRLAVYNAAIAAGKSKKQAAYEAKDLMDFSMSGDWPVIQFLVQTVPFMGARMQGLHRLGRGFVENPLAFTMKGTLVMMAGMALWFAFRDDERYKALEDWDKDTYFHWWIGDNHYRLPKPFEVGAIFNTIPERIMEYAYSKENDAGQLLMRRMGHMFTETFNMNPIPQTVRPLVESYFNYNFFTGRSIVNPYEEQRMAPEEYRYSTSPTMIELARAMPESLDTASGKIRSPLHLQNFYYQYTGTLGRYAMLAADAVVRDQMDYPNPPTWRKGDYPVLGRFFRGDEPRRTRYEEETYRLIRKITEIQGSLRFLEKTDQIPRFEEIETQWEPYIAVAKDLNDIRQEVSDINEAIMIFSIDPDMDPQEKRKRIDELNYEKNELFELGYSLRPGARPVEELTKADIEFMLNRWGNDTEVAERMEQTNPETFDLAVSIDTLGMRELERLAGASAGEN